ncbi:MAG TPA: phosphoglycerate mutase [Burkholderiaceae bacterium]
MPLPLRPAMHLLVPGAASRSPALAAALPGLRLPHLQTLLNQLTPTERIESDEQAWAMPCEQAVARTMGIPSEAGHIPWAAFESQTWGTPCAWIKPCHWQVGSDRILMGDPQALQLQEAESRALMAAMQPWFAEDGITLRYLALPGAWLASGAVFRGLPSASLERVVGRNINGWLPPASTAQGATLRRLQNEMQMLLYTHPLNDAREERGLPVVNSFWITGAGVLDTPVPAHPELMIEPRLCAPQLQQDAVAWADAWHAIDGDVCARLLEGVRLKLDIRLTLCGDRVAQTWHNTRSGPWQRITSIFGRRPASSLLESL